MAPAAIGTSLIEGRVVQAEMTVKSSSPSKKRPQSEARMIPLSDIIKAAKAKQASFQHVGEEIMMKQRRFNMVALA